MKQQSLIPSIFLMGSIFSASLILLVNVLPQHNTWLTITALYVVIFNAIVTVGIINKWGK
jgi:hypothetical protein